jgi:hypothetical protein
MEWNSLWSCLDLFDRRFPDIDLVTRSNNLPGPSGFAIQPNESAADQLLKPRPRILRKSLCQKMVKAQFRVGF